MKVLSPHRSGAVSLFLHNPSKTRQPPDRPLPPPASSSLPCGAPVGATDYNHHQHRLVHRFSDPLNGFFLKGAFRRSFLREWIGPNLWECRDLDMKRSKRNRKAVASAFSPFIFPGLRLLCQASSIFFDAPGHGLLQVGGGGYLRGNHPLLVHQAYSSESTCSRLPKPLWERGQAGTRALQAAGLKKKKYETNHWEN